MFGRKKKKQQSKLYRDSAGTGHRYKYNAVRANKKASSYKMRLRKARRWF